MKKYALFLLLNLIVWSAICQQSKVCIPIEKAEIIWRDREHCKITIEENRLLLLEADTLRRANSELKKASEAAQNEAGAQRVIVGIRGEQIEACHQELAHRKRGYKASLWKARAYAAGGWLLAGVFGYLVVSR